MVHPSKTTSSLGQINALPSVLGANITSRALGTGALVTSYTFNLPRSQSLSSYCPQKALSKTRDPGNEAVRSVLLPRDGKKTMGTRF